MLTSVHQSIAALPGFTQPGPYFAFFFLGHLGCGREWQSHPPRNEVIGAVDHAQLRKFRVEFLSQAICGPSRIQYDGSLQKGGPAVWPSDNLVTVEEFDGDAATRAATRIWSAIERMEWSVAISR